MTDIQTSLIAYGPLLVFLNVVLEQAGLPIPAYPLLIMAGALIAHGELSWSTVLFAAVAGCMVADTGWYFAGRRFGEGLLKTVCRVSASRDICISQTQSLYMRVGLRILLVAKFLPGAGALATVMAGLTQASLKRFLGFELAGSLIWVASALLLGFVFNDAVAVVLDILSLYGIWGLGLLATALLIYIGVRFVRRWTAIRRYRHIRRLRAAQLHTWQSEGRTHCVIDVRAYASERIPNAILSSLHSGLGEVETAIQDRATPIVVYCDCPDEISAAMLADRLRAVGYTDVWALLGGFEAWRNERARCEAAPAAALETLAAPAPLVQTAGQ